MIPLDYQVEIEAFQGPMDLLLYLIRKNEVDLHDLPVSAITRQFLDHLHAGGLQRLGVEAAGEFLLMAATLMEIKSRLLMPAAAAAGGGEGEGEAEGAGRGAAEPPPDPRAVLVAQLLDYKRLRDAAQALEQRQRDWSMRFAAAPAQAPEAPAHADEDAALDLEDLTLIDLVGAFTHIIETVDFARVGEHRIVDDDTPIHIHAQDVLERLRTRGGQAGTLLFTELFEGRTRAEAIGLFLAMLELMRHGRLTASQAPGGGAIWVALRPEAEGEAPGAVAPESSPA